jgi:hypothetical protein
MKKFITYTIVWVASNLAIPFWTIGHIHLSINVYEDIHEIIASFGMNIIVLTGFIIEYNKERKNGNNK